MVECAKWHDGAGGILVPASLAIRQQQLDHRLSLASSIAETWFDNASEQDD
jgi:hypothetical protein